MSAEKIILRIEEDARADAAATAESAKQKAQLFLENEQADAARQAETIAEKAALEIAEIKHYNELMEGLAARKEMLEAKRSVVDEAFAQGLQEVCALPKERWEALIRRLMLRAVQTGEETICVPAGDLHRYGAATTIGNPSDSVLVMLNKAVESERNLPGHLTMDETPGKFAGGFRLVGKKFDVDCSFETLLREVREQKEREVFGLLFPTEV